jgi:hypothetical protein
MTRESNRIHYSCNAQTTEVGAVFAQQDDAVIWSVFSTDGVVTEWHDRQHDDDLL